MIHVLQFVTLAAVVYYLCRWRLSAQRRNSETWESLLARLRPDWSAKELSDRFLWHDGLDATPEDAWRRMEGPKGLLVMYQNAKVLMDMANFAARQCKDVDPVLISTLHSDALQIRIFVLAALSQYAFTAASEGVRVNAYRAAAVYTGMAARTTQLLQNYAAGMIPDFVAAM